MIDAFIEKFTDKKIKWTKLGESYFLIPTKVENIAGKIEQEAFSIGLPLGEEKKDRFLPSIPLLQWLSESSTKKVVINEKAEWLFLCGRDAFETSIIKHPKKAGKALVQNTKDENLGYGLITKHGVNNILDAGMYLRMER